MGKGQTWCGLGTKVRDQQAQRKDRSVLYDHAAVKAEGRKTQNVHSNRGVPSVPRGQGAALQGSSRSIEEGPRLANTSVTSDIESIGVWHDHQAIVSQSSHGEHRFGSKG